MDNATRDFIYRVFAIAIALIMVSFAVVCVKIMWTDGNTPLVTSISNNVSWLLIALVVSIASVLIGRDVTQTLVNRPVTTLTTQPVTMITPVATITQQKAAEEITPT